MGIENIDIQDLENKWIDEQHGGNLEQEARRLGIQKNSIIDASASLVPFALPERLSSRLIKAIKGTEVKAYPDRSHRSLKEAIGKHHNISPKLVLPGNGASELITWAARDAAKHGVSNLPSPGFSDYKRALRCWNAKYFHSPLPLQWDSQYPQPFPIKSTSNVIWITNPHNPTGQLWSKASLEELLKTHSLVICDEAFLPLVPNGEQESLIPLVESSENLIVIRSLTKLFSIPGLRLGYAISSSQRLQEWASLRDPWPLNGLAIVAGVTLINERKLLKDRLTKVHNWLEHEGAWFKSNLENLSGIIPHSSSTNFYLIESDQSLVRFREALARKKILLRDCQSFEDLDERWLRISLQNKAANRKIIKSMKESIIYIS